MRRRIARALRRLANRIHEPSVVRLVTCNTHNTVTVVNVGPRIRNAPPAEVVCAKCVAESLLCTAKQV